MKNIALLIIVLGLSGCSKEPDKLKKPELKSDVIDVSGFSLTLKSDSIYADGSSFAELTISTNSATALRYKTVTFSVSPIAKFSNNSSTMQVTLDVTGVAKAYLVSDNAGIANVIANIPNLVTIQHPISFVTSWPTQILVEPSVSLMTPTYTSQTQVVAKLSKTNGSVSNGLVIQFSDSTITNSSIGVFLNTTTTYSSQATTKYWLQDTSYHGFVYIRTSIMTDKGKIIGRSRIFIQ
jgi:hypothetical protein